ncbi:GntR family transcriptional regulator [Luteimonas sp. R10]|uniref:GntR family transcriptional regulator n=1 Tax=Luteimonas sp. R10 TaxID=3108176 RepID=UPI003088F9DE|nr:GntR family transcriptional regulator [Luteimonas sp. R10]
MNTAHFKAELVYAQVKRALKSGRYVPGQRLDLAKLAAEHNASLTPARYALYRLVGERLIELRAGDGLLVPLPSETALRELYWWMEQVLLMACDPGISQSQQRAARTLEIPSPGDDVVELTWQLFDAIGEAAGKHPLHQVIARTNDQLAPIRRTKQHLLEHGFDELLELVRYWNERDFPALRSALRGYHARRRRLVPSIVAALLERRNALH